MFHPAPSSTADPERRPAPSRILIAAPYVLASLLLLAMLGISARTNLTIHDLFSDSAHTTNGHPLLGMLQILCSFFWCAAATVCLLAAVVLWRDGGSGRLIRFFIVSMLLSSWMGTDDVFMLHERILPWYGFSEIQIIGTYGLVVLAYVAFFRRELLAFWPKGFVWPVVLLIGSLIVDELRPALGLPPGWPQVLEDGFKLVGLGGWFGYYGLYTASLLHFGRPALSETQIMEPAEHEAVMGSSQ